MRSLHKVDLIIDSLKVTATFFLLRKVDFLAAFRNRHCGHRERANWFTIETFSMMMHEEQLLRDPKQGKTIPCKLETLWSRFVWADPDEQVIILGGIQWIHSHCKSVNNTAPASAGRTIFGLKYFQKSWLWLNKLLPEDFVWCVKQYLLSAQSLFDILGFHRFTNHYCILPVKQEIIRAALPDIRLSVSLLPGKNKRRPWRVHEQRWWLEVTHQTTHSVSTHQYMCTDYLEAALCHLGDYIRRASDSNPANVLE